MLHRKTILHVLMWALGIAALTGATAVIAQDSAITGRIAGSAALVAGACVALLPLAMRFFDSPGGRSARLAGMFGVAIELLLALSLVWDFNPNFGSEDATGGAMATVLFATLVAMTLLWLMRKPWAVWAGRVGLIVTVPITATAVLGSFWERYYGYHAGDRLLQMSGVSWFFAATLFVTLIRTDMWAWRIARWVGVALTAAGWCLVCLGIWSPHNPDRNHVFQMSVAGASSAGICIAYINLALLAPLKVGQGWLRWVAIGSVLALAGSVGLAFYTNETGFVLLIGAAAIFAGCATLGLMVMVWFNRGGQSESLPHEFSRVALTCPRCQRPQSMPLGDSACQACGLRISVRVEEPRCANCGYLLYQVQGNACPECGSAIADFPGRTAVV